MKLLRLTEDNEINISFQTERERGGMMIPVGQGEQSTWRCVRKEVYIDGF